ncbi:dihydropteroate synthase [Devosia naphthalenivorans]|uniref:dihydropteroate synthase n=1 Tax=Devosia naphthalenivorans TaxID=2082392 RepID=UPI0013B06ABA|nr:dihydropteroate synthase [Devosia naphthalenivorans]
MIQLSTGVAPMPVQQELDRIIPLLDEMIAAGITAPIAIATTNPLVADQAIQSGASLIVDLDNLAGAPEMAEIAALHQVPVIARASALAIARAKAADIQLILDFGQTLAEGTGYPILVGPMLPQAAISAYRAGAHILRVDDLIAITTHFQDASW